MNHIFIRFANWFSSKADIPKYKNNPYNTDVGIFLNPIEKGSIHTIRQSMDCNKFVILCSCTLTTSNLSDKIPSSIIRFFSMSDFVCNGACGIKPLVGGRPNNAVGNIPNPNTRKSQWNACPFFNFISGLCAMRLDTLWSKKNNIVIMIPGNMAANIP